MYKPLYKGIYKVGTVVIAPILITFPLNRRFQPWIFCYCKGSRKAYKERKIETDIAILLLYRLFRKKEVIIQEDGTTRRIICV